MVFPVKKDIEIVLMFTIQWLLLIFFLCLIGCNTPSLSSERDVPLFSSKNYEYFDCHQLKNEAEKLDIVIEQLSGVKNEPHYVMHTDMPFVGTGDNMGAVELIRSRAERNAIQRMYDQKGCPNSTD